MNDRIEMSDPLVSQALAPYENIASVAAGEVLFNEGDDTDGVYFLHAGETDLLFSSRHGEAKALLTAEPGQLLGLTSVVSGRKHDCTAIARTGCITGFIEKNRFLRLLDEKPTLWFAVLQMISSDINACWDCMRSLTGAAAR